MHTQGRTTAPPRCVCAPCAQSPADLLAGTGPSVTLTMTPTTPPPTTTTMTLPLPSTSAHDAAHVWHHDTAHGNCDPRRRPTATTLHGYHPPRRRLATKPATTTSHDDHNAPRPRPTTTSSHDDGLAHNTNTLPGCMTTTWKSRRQRQTRPPLRPPLSPRGRISVDRIHDRT